MLIDIMQAIIGLKLSHIITITINILCLSRFGFIGLLLRSRT